MDINLFISQSALNIFNTMRTISWNDLNDMDSSDESDRGSKKSEEKYATSLTNIQKPVNKYNEQNLKKLSVHVGQTVWLFVGNYYEKDNEIIDKILKNLNGVKKVLQFPKGWNVLVEKSYAKHLINEGHKHQKYILQFGYSTKNQIISNQNQAAGKKIKFIPKEDLLNREKNIPDKQSKVEAKVEERKESPKQRRFQSPKLKNHTKSQVYEQKSNVNQKKKYVEKIISPPKIIQEQIKHQNQPEPSEEKIKENLISVEKTSLKEEVSVMEQITLAKAVSLDISHLQQTLEKGSIQEAELQQTTQTAETTELAQEPTLTPKKSKKKKKNTTKSPKLKDPNNPFSYFAT